VNHIYIAIDLKSYYASAECVARNLDPLTTNLVVADPERSRNTICLAVSPSLKQYGISGRARMFEVKEAVEKINFQRLRDNGWKPFRASSYVDPKLKNDPSLELDYIIAPPRMGYYLKVSAEIYGIYLKYAAPEDILVYSIDEVFIDVTPYLNLYHMSAHDLAMTMIRDVLHTTGITATAGIGTNLFLAKVAMDITAKHMEADKDGVRIAELDEITFRKTLWNHTPLTDFWRIGHGTERRLNNLNLYTLGDVARCSLENEDILYKAFGVNAELLIDHAWGYESCTMKDAKTYQPMDHSLSNGQVLMKSYKYDEAAMVISEMADQLANDMVQKHLIADKFVIWAGYDLFAVENLGRAGDRGTVTLPFATSSSDLIRKAAVDTFLSVTDKNLLFRRLGICAIHVMPENQEEKKENVQLDLFGETERKEKQKEKLKQEAEREKHLQEALLAIQQEYGKNAVIKAVSKMEGATAVMRNSQIGGHKA